MKIASAAGQVFDTVELLEMILYSLPSRDLLLVQRVSKQWKSVIESSRKLQQALFMIPIEITDGPLALHYYDSSEDEDGYKIGCETQAGTLLESFEFFKNPLIQPLQSRLRNHRRGSSFTARLPLLWQLPGATWRKMLLMHPPVQVWAIYFEKTRQGFDEKNCRMMNTGTLRAGELTDWLDETFKSSTKKSCYKTVHMYFILECDEDDENDLQIRDLDPLNDNEQLEKLKSELAKIGD